MPIVLSSVPVPKPFTYGSLCSGIEAASVAWEPLGWKPAFFSEIEPFPSAVLAHHWPDVPNMGDMTKHKEWNHAHLDILVAGTPCQAFSVAGLRKGLLDARGNLTLTFIDIANQYDPDWIVWENVPGVLSSKDNAFGCFLGGLAGEDDALVPPGGKWANAGIVLGPQRTVAWRVLDAQYFGVAQRRRRVFVVASPRHGAGPISVLLEREGVRRDSPPSREKGEGFTHPVAPCIGASGRGFERGGDTRGQDPVVAVPEVADTLRSGSSSGKAHGKVNGTDRMTLAPTFWNGEQVTQTLNAHFGEKQGLEDQHVNGGCGLFVPTTSHTLKAEGFDASEDGTGRGVPLVPVAIGFGAQMSTPQVDVELMQTLGAKNPMAVTKAMQVRRLLPVECERLQGFPDDHTLIPWRKKPAADCPDGPRYRAIGNSMAVPVMNWIGSRIKRFMEGTL